MPDAKPMAFKGGTSLSKVYGAINRFSEDVDVTIDYRSFGHNVTVEELVGTSNKVRDNLTNELREAVQVYTEGTVRPYLEARFVSLGLSESCSFSVGDDGEKMEIGFPSLFTETNGYLRQHVLVEFGGRNIIDLHAVFDIQPDITDRFPGVTFPKASVTVLKAERTFWEKATLIHAACNKGIRSDRNRDSRHWYDLAMLANCAIGGQAKQDMTLLSDVVMLKKVFYRQASAEYDKCLSGELILVPSGECLTRLQSDYDEMISSGMMDGTPVSMAEILDILSRLQDDINLVSSRSSG